MCILVLTLTLIFLLISILEETLYQARLYNVCYMNHVQTEPHKLWEQERVYSADEIPTYVNRDVFMQLSAGTWWIVIFDKV